MGSKNPTSRTNGYQPLLDRVRRLRHTQRRLLLALQRSIDETERLLDRLANDQRK